MAKRPFPAAVRNEIMADLIHVELSRRISKDPPIDSVEADVYRLLTALFNDPLGLKRWITVTGRDGGMSDARHRAKVERRLKQLGFGLAPYMHSCFVYALEREKELMAYLSEF